MKLWMVYNLHDYNINTMYYDMHVQKAQKHNIDIVLVIVEYLSFGVKNNKLYITYNNKNIDLPDGVIMRSRYSLLSKHLEMMNIPVFNNSYICEKCNNKAKTYQLITESNIDIVDSEFLLGEASFIKDNSNSEKVIKTVDGHGGSEVYLLDDFKTSINNSLYKEDKQHIKVSKDMVLQPLVKGNNNDLRVYILDNEIIGSVLRKGNNSFKSNYSLGGDVKFYKLNKKEKDTVYKILELFKEKTKNYKVNGIFYGGIDFIINNNGELLFNEIEDVVGSRMLYATSNIDIVDEYLKSILKRY